MTATVDTVMMAARTHLNDDSGINWPDPNLLPKLQEAYRDLLLELELSGIQVIQVLSVNITVPTNTTDLTTIGTYPTDVISPIALNEKLVGEADEFFVPMTSKDFIPNIAQTTRLNYWSWRQNKIYLLGALNATVVQLQYRASLAVPTLNTDPIGVNLGESYLSYRTAAIACNAAKDYKGRDEMNIIAATNLAKLLKYYVTYEKQLLPTKRMPYHRRFRRLLR